MRGPERRTRPPCAENGPGRHHIIYLRRRYKIPSRAHGKYPNRNTKTTNGYVEELLDGIEACLVPICAHGVRILRFRNVLDFSRHFDIDGGRGRVFGGLRNISDTVKNTAPPP